MRVQVKKPTLAVLLAGMILMALVLLASRPSQRVSAQVTPIDPSVAGEILPGGTEDYGNLLPRGVETRGAAMRRLGAYKPDPVKFPVPRTTWDGKPDLSGVYWPGARVGAPKVPLESMYRPDARALRERTDFINWRNGYDNPTFHCWPRSPMGASTGPNAPLQLVHAPGFVLMLDEEDHRFRIIPTDGGAHDPNAKPSFMGDSVGHWEGDTLVVDVTNFNGKPWLAGGSPPQTSSDALHIVERWSRPDGQTLDYQAVVEDSKLLSGPWTALIVRRGRLAYDMIQESLCMEDPDLAAREETAARLREQQGLPRNANEAQRVLGQQIEAARRKGNAK